MHLRRQCQPVAAWMSLQNPGPVFSPRQPRPQFLPIIAWCRAVKPSTKSEKLCVCVFLSPESEKHHQNKYYGELVNTICAILLKINPVPVFLSFRGISGPVFFFHPTGGIVYFGTAYQIVLFTFLGEKCGCINNYHKKLQFYNRNMASYKRLIIFWVRAT